MTTAETPIGAATTCPCGVVVSTEADTPSQRSASRDLHGQSLGHVGWAWRAGRAVTQAIAIPIIDPLERRLV